MKKKYTFLSFCMTLFCIGAAAYSLYSYINNTWLVVPPSYILLLVAILAFCFAVAGMMKEEGYWWAIIRSWLVLILSALTSTALLLVLLFTSVFSFGGNTHIKTVSSPDETYTINFYRWDAGAAGSFGVRGELNGPLWFKKRIYYQDRAEQVEVEWESNDSVSINNHILKLDEGDTYGYQ
ncbi:hypothetical protein GCM10011351_31260 [Paraliobacillus quinghaiensis]|uniref:Uncharacterized protein n=1 Tax=Paraliobacillus quinghaiensis TaxID=470815 RepID=A0A917TXU9_9BACI|nr:DUF5412 family protein [Paraliobacillus quinghaiensis]GGM43032.1 hypothetical protein GCM10011351_31260 [Paraliobacillus quinghaiensis]